MSNPQLESIADQRRAAELAHIKAKRESVQRRLTTDVIGMNGAPRPASQTAEIQKVADELDARAERLRSLAGDELIAEFAPNEARIARRG